MTTQLQAILNEWPLWPAASKPTIIGELAGGLTNTSYLLQIGDTQWVLRINHPDSHIFDIDRTLELQIHHAAAKAGLSPKIIYHAPDFSYWIREFIAGEVLSANEIDTLHLEQIASKLRRLHEISSSHLQVQPLDVLQKVEHYLDQVQDCHQTLQLRRDLADIIHSEILNLPGQSVCHMDPLPANWIKAPDGELWLLDLEYASIAHPALDYAAVWLHLPTPQRSYWSMLHPQLSDAQKKAATKILRLLEQSWYLAKNSE